MGGRKRSMAMQAFMDPLSCLISKSNLFLVLHLNLRRARGKAEDFNGLHTWVHVRLLFVSMNVPFVDEMLS